MESLFELLRTRRTVRVFEDRDVPTSLVVRALEAATWAPSAHNSQPWRFIVIGKGEVRKRLINVMSEKFMRDLLNDGVPRDEAENIILSSTERFMKAPILVLFCLAKEDLEKYPDEARSRAEWIMGIQSVAAAIQNFLLALHALGLAGCWRCAPLFAQEEVKEVLKLPEDYEPQAIVEVGYPAEKPGMPKRKPLSQVIRLIHC
ncbi:MAG: nitroreductase family protein [Candidatus Nezhaarchaeales archaeon]|nr:MAG: nitroreductase family protein [Candidatus Nezhaarchaeota archaeon WYZ-LMO7]TDA35200.1 MAG: nitroreductase family protein [Candidatus Nezhaarchaeota archaeon WYZ-LMO8]